MTGAAQLAIHTVWSGEKLPRLLLLQWAVGTTVLQYRLDANTPPLLCQKTSFSPILLLILDGRLCSSPVAALPQQNVDRKRGCRSTQPLVPGSNDAIQSLGPPCIPVSRRYVWRRLGDQRYRGSLEDRRNRRVVSSEGMLLLLLLCYYYSSGTRIATTTVTTTANTPGRL